MLTKKIWLALVVILGGGACVALSAVNSFVPHLQDLSDPLGRPSNLANQVIHSASQFDQITGMVLPHQENLGQRIQTLRTVSVDLNGIVGKAGGLPPAAKTVNANTTSVDGTAEPLPALIGKVTGRANQATPGVGSLTTAIGSATAQFQDMHGRLRAVQGDLATLGPRAGTIVSILGQIEDESSRIKPLGPVLSLLSGALPTDATTSGGSTTTGIGSSLLDILSLGR